MTIHSISGKEILVVETQPCDFVFNIHLEGTMLSYEYSKDGVLNIACVIFSENDWQLLGVSDSLTEEQARGIVENKFNGNCYENYFLGGMVVCDTALESFHSWLTSRGYDLEKRYCILIKQNNAG